MISRLYIRAHYTVIALTLAALGIALSVATVHRYNDALRREGATQLLVHVSDSTVKVLRDSLQHSSVAVAREVVTVPQLIERVRVDTLWRSDTVRIAGDTTARLAVPVATVQGTDSTIRACSLLASDCAAFRLQATRTMQAQAEEIDALKHRPERSCSIPALLSLSAGLAGGIYLRGHLP